MPPEPEYVPGHWGAVDEASDPGTFVRYLDAVDALDEVRWAKRRSYDLLWLPEGGRALDVGCGLGGDARALAGRVGPTGRVVGLDASRVMIAEAARRTDGTGLPVEFRLGFADGTFDGCRAERVLVHLDDPSRALAEMARVTRAGGRVVAYDADWETLVVDAADRRLTRAILNFFCDGTGSRWVGRQLRRLLLEAGLADVRLHPETLLFTDYAGADRVFKLREAAQQARAAGVVSAPDAERWLETLERADASGRFFAAVTGFWVCGRKPA